MDHVEVRSADAGGQDEHMDQHPNELAEIRSAVEGFTTYAPTLGVRMASRRVELAGSASARSLPDVAAQDGGCGEQGCDAQHATHGGEERVAQHLCDAPE